MVYLYYISYLLEILHSGREPSIFNGAECALTFQVLQCHTEQTLTRLLILLPGSISEVHLFMVTFSQRNHFSSNHRGNHIPPSTSHSSSSSDYFSGSRSGSSNSSSSRSSCDIEAKVCSQAQWCVSRRGRAGRRHTREERCRRRWPARSSTAVRSGTPPGWAATAG